MAAHRNSRMPSAASAAAACRRWRSRRVDRARAMTHAHVFVALCIAWAISQSWIGLRRSGDKRKARDRGTLNILLLVIGASMALAVWLAIRDDGQLAARD